MKFCIKMVFVLKHEGGSDKWEEGGDALLIRSSPHADQIRYRHKKVEHLMQTHYMHYDVWQCDEKNKSKESVFLLSWRNG